MPNFSKYLRNGTLILTVSACLFGCAGVRSQSTSVDDNRPIAEPPSSVTVDHPKKDEDLETVVRRYCEHARKGNFSEIKDLVELLPEYLPPRSNTGFSDNGIFAEIDTLILEKTIPEMIFAGEFYIIKIIIPFESENKGQVEATLRSRVAPERSRTLIFSLHRKDSVWRIDDITFKIVDDVSQEFEIVRIET